MRCPLCDAIVKSDEYVDHFNNHYEVKECEKEAPYKTEKLSSLR